MGSPFGPGGTLRHGLLRYLANKITTRVAIKTCRGKICEREAWETRERNPRGGMAPAGLSKAMGWVVYFDMLYIAFKA